MMRKSTKLKILITALLLVFAVSMLAGCGSTKSSQKDSGASSGTSQKTEQKVQKKAAKTKAGKSAATNKKTTTAGKSSSSSSGSSSASQKSSSSRSTSAGSSTAQKSSTPYCTISINAIKLKQSDSASSKVKRLIPSNGYILKKTKVTLKSGDTVKSVLHRIARQKGIVITTKGSDYVSGINGISEFDGGDESGWMYSVNGKFPSSTAYNKYKVKNGDRIEWHYTLALGDDL